MAKFGKNRDGMLDQAEKPFNVKPTDVPSISIMKFGIFA